MNRRENPSQSKDKDLPRTTASVVTAYCHRTTSNGSSGGLAHTFWMQLYWTPNLSVQGQQIRNGKVHRLAVPMVLALLPNQLQSFTYLRRRIAEKPGCFTIVTHNDVQKSRPGYVYLRIRAELEYTRLLLCRIGIALKRNIQNRVMQTITKGKERTYVQMECRHTVPSKL